MAGKNRRGRQLHIHPVDGTTGRGSPAGNRRRRPDERYRTRSTATFQWSRFTGISRADRRCRAGITTPTTRPPLPKGAVRGDIRKQNFCQMCNVPRYFYVDEPRSCIQCGEGFVFGAGEQKFWYETLGFYARSEAVRCRNCRKQRRSDRRCARSWPVPRPPRRRTRKTRSACSAPSRRRCFTTPHFGQGDVDKAVALARRVPRLADDGRGRLLGGGLPGRTRSDGKGPGTIPAVRRGGRNQRPAQGRRERHRTPTGDFARMTLFGRSRPTRSNVAANPASFLSVRGHILAEIGQRANGSPAGEAVMAMFVHLAPESRVPLIRRNGIGRLALLLLPSPAPARNSSAASSTPPRGSDPSPTRF